MSLYDNSGDQNPPDYPEPGCVTQTMLPDGRWVPAIPLPFYGFRKRCECGRKFFREENYEEHWQLTHSGLGYIYCQPTTPSRCQREALASTIAELKRKRGDSPEVN